ncbi:Hypothetical protein AA314_05362 [Archangium gephyra]|uniref:Uncharacterized protein n=1 Tax=Archangium gephyra TaxID=48 RepID=A0AAC8TGP1_9BACT|nr:Hypothetical protein AA314_05362 [Archangium gephyra]
MFFPTRGTASARPPPRGARVAVIIESPSECQDTDCAARGLGVGRESMGRS